MKILRGRIALLLILISTGVGLFLLRHSFPDLMSRTLPTVALLAVWECWSIVYVVGRRLSYTRREARRLAKPAYSLTIPAGVRKAEQFNGVTPLDTVQHRLISEATNAQGSYFQTGILAASLPPVALLMLSLQLLVFPLGGEWALGLIIAEILCLGRLAFIALTQQKPTTRWMESRIRAELIRREQYLLIARIGPYLELTGDEILEEASRRAGLLEGLEKDELRSMISAHGFLNIAWLDHMPVQGESSDLIDRMDTYLYRRIGKQLLWFSNEIRDCEENESLWSKVLAGSLLCALFAAVMHFMRLLQELGHPQGAVSSDVFGVIVGTLAVSLPPAATAIISMKNMYAFQGRTKAYSSQRASLLRFDGELKAAVRKFHALDHLDSDKERDRSYTSIDRQFKALAILVEASLANEMEKWILIMEREAIEVNA
jgi:hypothetical protein